MSEKVTEKSFVVISELIQQWLVYGTSKWDIHDYMILELSVFMYSTLAYHSKNHYHQKLQVVVNYSKLSRGIESAIAWDQWSSTLHDMYMLQ